MFFNAKYFDLFDKEKGFCFTSTDYSSSDKIDFTVNDLINGIVKYTIECDDTTNDCVGNVMSKHMKQRFNKILPGDILNKYVWIYNEFKTGEKKKLVTIQYTV
jgi:hypothetical protein